MDVSGIVARLDAECPSIVQFIAANSGGTQAPVSTQASLCTLLEATVSNRMYPLQLPEKAAHPSIVYQMVSSSPGVFEGYQVTHTDTFILNVRGPDYDALLVLVATIIAALDGESIEINDILHDYDQQESLYRINLDVAYTYITSASQALPAAYVYPLSRSGNPSVYDNFTKQLVSEDFAILVITGDGDMPALLGEIQAALVGWQQSPEHHEMEYGNGSSIEGVGGLELWRETYGDAFYMTQV